MSSHFVSLKRGVEGTAQSDFTTGTSSAATDLFELRVLDGVTPARIEITKALEAFKMFFETRDQVSAAGFDCGG
jgi:hypothetical protein